MTEQYRPDLAGSTNVAPEPPLPVVAGEPPWLGAYGDDHQLIVFRNTALRDSDAMLYPVVEHIERHGMVLIDRRTEPDRRGQCEVSWYVVPQLRLGLLAGEMGELPR
jgi:hypothetical protein